jgi:hypothetical protein
MRTTLTAGLGLAALLFSPPALKAQGDFEGVITYQMHVEGMTITMKQMTKGSKIRTEMEMPGMPGPMYVLMDMESSVMQTVLPSMGMYMEVNMKQMMDQVDATGNLRRQAAETPKIERLGSSETIAGIPCQNYRFTQGTEEMEGCIATGMGSFMGGGAANAGPLEGLGIDFAAYAREFPDGMLPLRMRLKEGDTWRTFMEATSVERKSLDDSLFRLPPGLQRMQMPGGLN